MLDLVGNPNCWFCHAQAQILVLKRPFSPYHIGNVTQTQLHYDQLFYHFILVQFVSPSILFQLWDLANVNE